LLWNS